MTQTSNNTVNAIINNFNKASKKAQKNDTYVKTVKVTDDIRLIYDLGWYDNHYLGNIRIQQKQVNGRYETIGMWVWDNGDFESFVEKTFDVMLDTDSNVLTEEERKVAEKAKELSEELHRKVTVEELVSETKLTEKSIRDALRMSGNRIEYIEAE